ncbi:hypothetical protein CATMIT_01582, partial [Catenibacterium mitsuokai DSM 15897]
MRAAAGEEEHDARVLAQALRRFDHVLQAMGHAVRAEVADHELAVQVVLPGHRCIARRRPVALQVHAVEHDMDLVCVHAALDQLLAEGLGDRNDGVGAAVQEHFELFEHPDRRAALHRADRGDRGRPQVAQFEHERPPLDPRQRPAAERAEELRRGRHHHVVTALEQPGDGAGGHEAEVIQGALEEALVGGDVGLDPHHADAVERLDAAPGVAVAGEQLAFGEVRRAGDHSDLVAGAHPAHRVLVGAR